MYWKYFYGKTVINNLVQGNEWLWKNRIGFLWAIEYEWINTWFRSNDVEWSIKIFWVIFRMGEENDENAWLILIKN